MSNIIGKRTLDPLWYNIIHFLWLGTFSKEVPIRPTINDLGLKNHRFLDIRAMMLAKVISGGRHIQIKSILKFTGLK